MDEVQIFLSDYNDVVEATALRLRTLVKQILSDANEVVTGHKNISYSTDAGQMKGGIVYIAPFKDSVNLGFIDGVDLDDPEKLLKGTGKRLRHIKFTTVSAVEEHEAYIVELLQQAQARKA